jgi:hypothetical protein
MVISNIGTIILSLPSSSSTSTMNAIPNTDVSNSTQVRLISIANTFSRLLVGPLADFISPVASYLPSGVRCFPRKHHVSRVAFLSVATFLLAVTFFWMEVGIRSQEAVWILRYEPSLHLVGWSLTFPLQFGDRLSLRRHLYRPTKYCFLYLGLEEPGAKLRHFDLCALYWNTSLLLYLCICIG